MSGSLAADNQARPALRRFTAGLRWRLVLGRGLGAASRWGLLFGVPLVAVAWLAPTLRWSALSVYGGALLVVAVFAVARAWWQSRAALVALRASLAGSGDGVGALRDELLTWLELDGDRAPAQLGAARAGMLRWLEQDVHQRLSPHRRQAERHVGRLRLGRWRWLAPVVLALLLAWWIGSWWQPPWSGAVGGREDLSASADKAGGGGGAPEQEPGAGGDEDPQQRPDRQQDGEQEREFSAALVLKADDGDEGEQDDEAEPPPLVEAPDDRRFVLPDYIGDGPTRRQLMHVAELEQPQAGGAASPQRAPQGGGQGAPTSPPPAAAEFERAAERAQRSRHVPDAERAIVRRFFDELQKRGKR